MRISIEKVENGWTIDTISSPKVPTRTVRVALDRKELMRILESIIPQD